MHFLAFYFIYAVKTISIIIAIIYYTRKEGFEVDLIKLKEKYSKHNIKGKYRFTDRKKDRPKLVLLLIGYKRQLWDDILPRFKSQLDDDMDVCLVSSGRYFDELENLARENDWSYISTKKNNVCLIQNIAISLFKKASLIFKVDEDIFLTKDAFKKMESAMVRAQEESPYNIGMAAPLLNLNAYGYYRILEKLGKLSDFESRFGKAKMAAGRDQAIETSGDIACFMWGEDGTIPHIDKIDELFSQSNPSWSICPIRLSIGCILYKRSFWEDFGRFPVVIGDGMGLDETIMIAAGAALSQTMAVAEDCAVGHFGYKDQGAEMMKLYCSRRDLFSWNLK